MTETRISKTQTFFDTVERSLDSALARLDDAANLRAMLAEVEKQIQETWPEILASEDGGTVSADDQVQLSEILDKIKQIEEKALNKLGITGKGLKKFLEKSESTF